MIDGITLLLAVLNIGTLNTEKIKGLHFIHLRDNFYTIRGSLHKNKNNGIHNGDDFCLSELINVLNQLFNEVGLKPHTTVLNAFEFGVNIKLSFNPDILLDHIIWFKDAKVKRIDNYLEFKQQLVTLKIYNKSKQKGIPEPFKNEYILRIEIKINKRNFFKLESTTFYCKVLSDLLDITVLEQLEKLLIETFNKCIIVDFTEKEVSLLSDKDRDKYKDYKNPLYWKELYKETKENRNKRSREFVRCNKLINQYSKSTLKTEIINLISEKCKELRDVEISNVIEKKWYELTTSTNNIQLKDGTNYPVDKRVICTSIEPTEKDGLKRCLSCGRIILNPRKNQRFCSELRYGKEVKRCRNINSNPRNNAKRAYNSILVKGELLFDIYDYIAPEKKVFINSHKQRIV